MSTETDNKKNDNLPISDVRLSLSEIKDKIAIKWGKENWKQVLYEFEYGMGISKMIGFEELMDTVAEAYANNEA